MFLSCDVVVPSPPRREPDEGGGGAAVPARTPRPSPRKFPRTLVLGAALVFASPLTGALVGCTVDSAGGGGEKPNPGAGSSVSFDDHATLELAPSALHQVHATTAPGATVTFLLIGDSYDASLDQGVVQADDNGRVVVTLKAPSKPSTFHLVATTGKGATDDLAVAVSELGFGSVRVSPKYTGSRKVAGWTASVVVGASCDAVLSGYPKDPAGALHADAPSSGQPVVTSVPVGPTLAVAIRSGQLMWGCTETILSSPKSTLDLSLDVLNRPMVLSSASLTLGLEFSPAAQSYSTLLDDSASLLSSTAFPQGTASSGLLDAMRALVPAASQASFDQHRQSAGLDAAVAVAMKADPRVLVSGWLVAAKAGAPPSAPQITGVLKGNPSNPGQADFSVTALGPVSAATAGVSPMASMMWSANADDTLVIGGHFTYSPTRYVGALIAAQALQAAPTAVDCPDAIQSAIDCAAIGPLVEGFDGCMSSCGEALCQQAVSAMWQRGVAAADDLGVVDVAASGGAQVDDVAEPASMLGNWVGDLTALGTSCVVKGIANGQAAIPPG